VGKIPEDIRPEWLNIARRLQSKARGNQPGILLLRIDILVDMDGNPIIWSKPECTLMEPTRMGEELRSLRT